MKKLIPRLALLAAPFIAYAALFFWFEPYDYFGLKGGAVKEDSILTRVRSYLNSPADQVLIGDSRMAHFDMELVEQLTGRPCRNLAFGGASMNEMLDLFELALERNPELDTCYFEVSFYLLRSADARNRTGAIRTVVENPAAYLFNFNFNVDMLAELASRLRGIQTGATRDEGHWTEADYVDETGAPLPFRQNLMEYGALIRSQCEGFRLNKENLARLLALAETCRARGIRLIFVFPPVDESITRLVVEPLQLAPTMAAVKAALAETGAEIRDFELEPEAIFTQQQFYDGFHLDVVHGLPEYTRLLFAA